MTMRTSADRDDTPPGLVEIGLVGNEAGNSKGKCFLTGDIIDIATGSRR